MDDLECDPLPDTSLSYGYCDRGSFDCMTDCRTGQDPVTGKTYNDCRPPYGCATDGGTHDGGGFFCKIKTCLESGGASIACSRGQYCCGEDKDNDGHPDPCPDAGLDDQNCYDAAPSVFCVMCMNADDCAPDKIMDPAYVSCANGSKSPNCSLLPWECYGYMDPGGNTTGVCAPPTYNSTMIDSNMRQADNKGCPTNFSAQYEIVNVNGMGDDFCEMDSDCNQGTDAGQCAPDMSVTLRDGGHPKACLCTIGSAVQQCPNTDDGGVFSFCRNGNMGQTTACMHTVSCFAPPAYVFGGGPDSGMNGCGFQ
jgi:hypothetical protein